MHGSRISAVAAVLVTAVAGCSSSTAGPTTRSSQSSGALHGTLTVYAASSLTEAFDTIKTAFVKQHPGLTVAIRYGASSDLATQINNGAPADVFASASPKNMAAVKAATAPVTFARNSLEIATSPKNPAKIASVADLGRSGVKVAVCAPAVPCGAVAAKVFANARVHVRPVANEANVKATLAVVESGEVDAGLIYVSDVHAAGRRVHGIPIPAKINASTDYPIAALASARNAAAARAFMAYVRSPAATSVLTADGFAAP